MKQAAPLELRPEPWSHTFLWNEEPVLHCALSLPLFSGVSGRGARRISRYYTRLNRWLRSQWEHQAFPAACAALQSARAASLPFQPFEETVSFQCTRNGEGLFSLYWDSRWSAGGPRALSRWGDTWSLDTGAPLAMSDLFPKHTNLSQLLIPLAEEQAGAALRSGTACFYSNYNQLLREHFDPKHFYIQADHLIFFYPPDTIAPPEAEIPCFSCPLSAPDDKAAETSALLPP